MTISMGEDFINEYESMKLHIFELEKELDELQSVVIDINRILTSMQSSIDALNDRLDVELEND